MTKFEEMRLRAIHFQKMTGCHLCIKWDRSIQLHCAHAEFKDGEFIIDDIEIENPTEEEWIKEVESYGGYGLTARFPSLLEAQGWIAVEDGLPKDKEMTQVRVDMFGSVVSGVSVGFKNHPERPFFSNVSTTDGTWCGGYGIIGEVRITHWKPLDIFPEPFEPSNV